MAGIAPISFNRIWTGIVAFLATIEMPAEVETVAIRDGRPTFYDGFNPQWIVERGELDAIEDLAPIIRVDLLDWPHDEPDGSADDYVQFWRMEFAIGIAALTSDERENAITRFFDVCAVIANKMMGSGSYIGIDPETTGITRAVLTGGRWASGSKGDGYLCSGFMLLRVRVRWAQTED